MHKIHLAVGLNKIHTTMLRCLVLAAVSLALLVLAPPARAGIPFTEKDLASEESLRALYEQWRSHYMVSRPAGLQEQDDKARQFNVFKENVRYIHEANKKGRPFRLALNKFADMTTDEFRRAYAAGSRTRHHRALSGGRRRHGDGSFMYADARNLPLAVDWRQWGAVTGIKDQGQCGMKSKLAQCVCIYQLIILHKQLTYIVCMYLLLKGAAGRSRPSQL
jgi:KDEL-tailed cysteine endopeptidase